MNSYLKFNCIYCGQHMECKPNLAGRQVLCPACRHRLVIPTPNGGSPARNTVVATPTWDTQVPYPAVETPTRYRYVRVANTPLAQVAQWARTSTN